MLPATERLKRSSVFQRAYTGRKSITTEYFTLYILQRQRKPQVEARVHQAGMKSLSAGPLASKRSLDEKAGVALPNKKGTQQWPLVGFVISKKVIKDACQRNRVKRRMREAYRCLKTSEKGENSVSSGESNDVIRSLRQWYAIVWVINEKVLNANWKEICKKMEECLLQASKKYGETGGYEKKRSGR